MNYFPESRRNPINAQHWRSRASEIQARLSGLSLDELLRDQPTTRPSHSNGVGLRRGYDPNQPRVPAGHSDGGQWTSEGRSVSNSIVEETPDTVGLQHSESFTAIQPRVRFAAARITSDYSNAFTGFHRIDGTTVELGKILEHTMQTMNFIPIWTPQVYGTAVHVAFGTAVRLAGLEGIGPRDVEHSFVGLGEPADYGEPGSIRTDVVLRNEAGDIIAIYDVKTGNAKLTPARVRELRRKTGTGPNVPIIELRFRRARLARRDKADDVMGAVIAQVGSRSFPGRWDRAAVS